MRGCVNTVSQALILTNLLWWLILCVNLTRSQDAQTFGQTLCWASLWGWFWVKWTFKLVNWVKGIAFLNMCGLIQSFESLNRTKRPTLPWVKTSPVRLIALSCHIGSFLPSDSNWIIGFSWVSSLPITDLKTCQPL